MEKKERIKSTDPLLYVLVILAFLSAAAVVVLTALNLTGAGSK